MEILNKLSWGDYLTAIGILVACYYTGVALLCYRTEISNLVLGSRKDYPAEPAHEASSDEIVALSSGLLRQIKTTLESAGTETSKPELILQLRQVLAGHPVLEIPAYRDRIYEYIEREAKQACGIGIGAQELES